MQKRITFKGITGSNDSLNVTEGECLEMVNLRRDGGSLRPVPEPVIDAELKILYKTVCRHEATSCYLCVTDDQKATVHFYDDKWNMLQNGSGQLLFDALDDVRGIEFLGYIVCCTTGKGMRYLIGGSGTYKWLGERPEVPGLDISIAHELKKLVTPVKFALSLKAELFEVSWRYNAYTYIDECILELNKNGCFIDRAMFKFALRLFDGSYIYCSQAIYVCDDELIDGVGRDKNNFYFESSDQSDDMYTITLYVKGFKPELSLSALNLENWKGIIVGIDVFTTGSIMGHSLETHTTRLIGSGEGDRPIGKFLCYLDKSLDDIYDEVASASQYYKIAEFDIDGNCLHELQDVSQNNLLMQQNLASASLPSTYSSIAAGCSTVFNNRLHLGSLREWFFKGYNAHSMLSPNGQHLQCEGIAVETKIRTLDGVSTVVQDYGMTETAFYNGLPELPPLLSYPDSRAFEMTVYVVLDTEMFYRTFTLTPHKYLNVAQYLHKWNYRNRITVTSHFKNGFVLQGIDEELLQLMFKEVGEYEIVYNAKRECWLLANDTLIPSSFRDHRMFAVPSGTIDGDKFVVKVEYSGTRDGFVDINNIPVNYSWNLCSYLPKEKTPYEERKNVLKVSVVDNPFVFPAKCTYAPSQKEVMVMAGNAMTLSQGQFGEHPLLVFCGDGIWAMSVDSTGLVAYKTSHLFSRDVCNDKDSVCGTNSGLVFIGEHGVMSIASGGVEKLSTVIELDGNNVKILSSNNVFSSIADFVCFGNVVDHMPFVEYVKSCLIAYDSLRNELLLANPRCEYMYVYSMSGRLWSKIEPGGIAGFIGNGKPFSMFQNNRGRTRILSRGESIVGKNRVLLFTRPLLNGTKLPKRICQFKVHACLSQPDNVPRQTPVFMCYLLCSNDGVHYRIIAGSEFYDDVNDVCFPYFPKKSYRYYMFALAGDVGESSIITGIDVDVENVWSNKLR